MERIKYKIESLVRGEGGPYVNLSFGLEGVLNIDSSRIDDSNLRNILPGRSVIVESELNHVVALYVPGNVDPFYKTQA